MFLLPIGKSGSSGAGKYAAKANNKPPATPYRKYCWVRSAEL